MAYRKKRTKKTYGRVFRTRKGKLGQYCYVNGKRVSFHRLSERSTPKSMRRQGRARKNYRR